MEAQESHYVDKLSFEIDSWDLRKQRESNEPPTVIDARSAAAYQTEHLPGAVSLPHREMSAETTAGLDRSRLMVVYCDGIGCNASTKGALNLLRLGFRVKELLGGLDWWKRDGYPTSAAATGGVSPVNPTDSADPSDCGCG